MNKILVLNSGGTFNKTYDELNGRLNIARNCEYIKEIVRKCFKNNLFLDIKGMIYKDSLDLTKEDRVKLLDELLLYKKSLLVHGTDTMNVSAKFFSENITTEIIVLTGSMTPYSIDPIEAVSNFSIALQFLETCEISGVYIAMHGLVKPYKEITKNRVIGKFECQS